MNYERDLARPCDQRGYVNLWEEALHCIYLPRLVATGIVVVI